MNKNLKNKYYSDIMIRWANGARYLELMRKLQEYAELKIPNNYIEPTRITDSRSEINKYLKDRTEKLVIDTARGKIMKEFKLEIVHSIYTILSERYERQWRQGRLTLDEIEGRIYHDAPFMRTQDMLYELIDRWTAETVTVEPKKKDLAALADDKQNVHTQVVNKQTNDAMAIFTKTVIPKGQSTLDEIINAWIDNVPSATHYIDTVYQDMRKWGNEKTVVESNDYLYRKTLRGVWAKIKTYENDIRLELIKRLWEECYESVGMCAQGHLSRLANVMVGFDSEATTSISPMEDFQNKIAALAASSLEDKISEAHKLMDAIMMPSQDRDTWLEALA
jgi:hypothetical protein